MANSIAWPLSVPITDKGVAFVFDGIMFSSCLWLTGDASPMTTNPNMTTKIGDDMTKSAEKEMK